MRITDKHIEFAVSAVAGQDALPLVKILRNKRDISEFKIAELLGEEVNSTRSKLYKLQVASLVSSIRKRDDIKGWYIYYWSFHKERVKEVLNSMKMEELTRLRSVVSRRSGKIYYICSSGCANLDFEDASTFGFRCPECGAIMDQNDTVESHLEQMRHKIRRLEKETS